MLVLSFIWQVYGFQEDQVWFQWYALQSRLENNIQLTEYAFKDTIVRNQYLRHHLHHPISKKINTKK